MKKSVLSLLATFILWGLSIGATFADDIELSTNRQSPSTNQFINLSIETDDDYVGKLTFSAKYKSSSSSSWTSISSLTSSSYFSDYSDEWSDGYYKMRSADDGEVTLRNLVKFKKSGYYRIYVNNTYGDQDYIQFSVWQNESNSDLKISVSPTDPDTDERIKLTIRTDDDYTGRINFTKLQYRSSSSSSWSNVSMTSSTYVSNYSSEWSNWYYRMTSSDDGEKIISRLLKFKKKWYYRIYVEDVDWNESYVQINVEWSSSGSSDEIELSTNRKSPSTNQFVNLTIETDDDYTWKLTFSVKYRSSSSSSWTSISNTTSSTYFSDYSDDWDNGYYKMKYSDRWEVTLKNLIKFKKKWYYRVYVKDTYRNESYIQFSVWVSADDDSSSSSKVDGFSTNELSKVKDVHKRRNSMISQMKSQYINLRRDTYWIRLSERLYDDMSDVVNNRKSRDMDDYDDFISEFNDWYKYTMKNI